MVQLCIYGAAALFCFVLYAALTRETYFSGRKAYRAKGYVRIVIPCGPSWQFLLEYSDPDGLRHSALSPTYDSGLPCAQDSPPDPLENSPLDTGEYVDITVRPFRFGPVRVDAIRIEDKKLVKQADYRPIAALGCIFAVMGVIRAVAIFLL